MGFLLMYIENFELKSVGFFESLRLFCLGCDTDLFN